MGLREEKEGGLARGKWHRIFSLHTNGAQKLLLFCCYDRMCIVYPLPPAAMVWRRAMPT